MQKNNLPFKPDNLNINQVLLANDKPKLFIETYGCQMNVNDSEIVVAILQQHGFQLTENIKEADTILINTCSIRDNAEQRVRGRLDVFKQLKKKKPSLVVGVIGCMAERLKNKLLEEEKVVDLIAGPDSYRDLPGLLSVAGSGQKAANVLLSREETYADISPVRLDANKVSAFISIMRGCNNMCAYCVVPYTRGAERSRDPKTILREAREVVEAGYREVTLLGQNVNSYSWKDENGDKFNFSKLLELVAGVSPLLRVRFATSHPKDISDELLYTIARVPNICKSIHLPVQSGSSRILKLMKRKYDREHYLERIHAIKNIIPGCSISTDIITGFCSETEEDHRETLSLMQEAGYDFAYMFKYSERSGTYAARHLKDDVAEGTKSGRLTEIINLQSRLSSVSKKNDVGKIVEVLVEGVSKKSDDELFGRTSQNKVVVFPKLNYKIGDYVNVEITGYTSATLKGIPKQ
jgi:tRNA-2-methylthio-N6-dimethylallyladenosine synthase